MVHRRDPTDDDVINLVTGQRVDQRQRVELSSRRVNRPWPFDPVRARRTSATPQRSPDDLPIPRESACRYRSAADRAGVTANAYMSTPPCHGLTAHDRRRTKLDGARPPAHAMARSLRAGAREPLAASWLAPVCGR